MDMRATATIEEVFCHPITILVGHAGVGKTNIALGVALGLAKAGFEVTLADLDVVNPYFRSSDYPQLLADAGIRLIAPVLARTTLDTPSLTGELDVAIEQTAGSPTKRLVIDVGGDDDGATTIGRWAARFDGAAAHVLYVVNAYRALTASPEEAAAMLPDIEWHAHLKADAVLNSTNLGDETSPEHVAHGRAFAREVARLCALPLEATVVPAVACEHKDATSVTLPLKEGPSEGEPLLLMPRLVRTPWDS